MKFTVTIESDNDALVNEMGGEEIARLLRDSADEIQHYGTVPGKHASDSARLRDANGNTVGEWRLEV